MLYKVDDINWINLDLRDISRIDIAADLLNSASDSPVYYVRIIFNDCQERCSKDFKTIDEARACAEKLVRALNEEE